MSTHEPDDRVTERFDEAQLARLREAFQAGVGRPEPDTCPSAGQLWGAVHGEVPAGELREVLDHLAGCPACAEEWRLARAFTEEEPVDSGFGTLSAQGRSASADRRSARVPRWLAAAAALVIALGVGGIWWSQQGPEGLGDEAPAVYREDPGSETAGRIESRLPEGEPLPRSEPVLRWTPVGGDSGDAPLYEVVVSTEDMTSVAEASDLEEPRYRLPDETLEGLPSGATLLWRVDATTADGRRISSPTFVTRLE